MPRTASAIGSLWSSPSTSTVKRPVIAPASLPVGADRPGALEQLGQLAEDGRRIALRGGSPAASPISRWAMAKRVTEFIRQQHVLVLVAQILGDGHGHVGGLAALQSRLVRGGDHDDGALPAPPRPASPR